MADTNSAGVRYKNDQKKRFKNVMKLKCDENIVKNLYLLLVLLLVNHAWKVNKLVTTKENYIAYIYKVTW